MPVFPNKFCSLCTIKLKIGVLYQMNNSFDRQFFRHLFLILSVLNYGNLSSVYPSEGGSKANGEIKFEEVLNLLKNVIFKDVIKVNKQI